MKIQMEYQTKWRKRVARMEEDHFPLLVFQAIQVYAMICQDQQAVLNLNPNYSR
jgi:hypothetical protein